MSSQQTLYFHPEQYFSDLIKDIDSARREVILETYVFKLDDVGEKVIKALESAQQRGVDLRLLVDGIGSRHNADEIASRLASGNSDVRVFHPLPWDFSVYRRALQSSGRFAKLLYLMASINHRDHRKLCLIDQKTAWLGSFNITSDHANPESDLSHDHWHDTAIRVTGPVVIALLRNFNQVWERKAGSRGERSRLFLARTEISKRRQPRLQLLRELEKCRDRIWITNAYFNPSRAVLKALKSIAANDVSVQLIVPSRSDISLFPSLSRSFYSDLLDAGIRVFEYQRRILHSKTMLIDQQLLIGSTNLNYRSLFHDMELDLLVGNPQVVAQMESRFCNDLQDCIEINPGHWQQYSVLNRLMGWLARFLRYWL